MGTLEQRKRLKAYYQECDKVHAANGRMIGTHAPNTRNLKAG